MSARDGARYIGRFAPSPTGPLHFGSLIAALASYADAKASAGCWHLRIEDLDPPREQAGAASLILATLEDFGFEWDGEVVYQSWRDERYREALALGGTVGLPEIYQAAGARLVFDAETMGELVDLVEKRLTQLRAA